MPRPALRVLPGVTRLCPGPRVLASPRCSHGALSPCTQLAAGQLGPLGGGAGGVASVAGSALSLSRTGLHGRSSRSPCGQEAATWPVGTGWRVTVPPTEPVSNPARPQSLWVPVGCAPRKGLLVHISASAWSLPDPRGRGAGPRPEGGPAWTQLPTEGAIGPQRLPGALRDLLRPTGTETKWPSSAFQTLPVVHAPPGEHQIQLLL